MNNFTYENQGTSTYLVYTLDENDYLDTMSLGMITNNKIPGIANTVFMQYDNQKFIKYNVSAKVSARQFFMGAVNKRRLLGVFKGIVDAMLSAEEYMIDHNMLLLDMDYIFADVSTCETVLICVPVLETELKQMDFSKFFKEIMFGTQFDQTENCDYVAKIINYLNSTPQFSLIDFQELLINVEMESSASVVHQYPKMPQKVTSQPIAHHTPQAQQPVNVQPTVVQPEVPPTPMPVPSAHNDLKIPAPPAPPVLSQENTKSEKPMSMFYLLQHYNKENAAAYKAQKDAKKAEKGQKVSETKKDKKEKKSKKANDMIAPPPMKVPGAPGTPSPSFAVPGQPVVPPPKVEMVSKPMPPVPPVQQIPSTPYPVQPQMPAYTTSGMQGEPSAGFGETTVLNAISYGETTVLSGELAPVMKQPYLIRTKNGEKILLNKPVFRIGKERSYVDYFIGDNAAISRSHANIITREGQYFVVDTNSTNHTYVNGRMIQSNEEVQITSGDNIKLGNEDFEFKIV